MNAQLESQGELISDIVANFKDQINFEIQGKIRKSVDETLNQLDMGKIRVCEKNGDDWKVNQWIKYPVPCE